MSKNPASTKVGATIEVARKAEGRTVNEVLVTVIIDEAQIVSGYVLEERYSKSDSGNFEYTIEIEIGGATIEATVDMVQTIEVTVYEEDTDEIFEWVADDRTARILQALRIR